MVQASLPTMTTYIPPSDEKCEEILKGPWARAVKFYSTDSDFDEAAVYRDNRWETRASTCIQHPILHGVVLGRAVERMSNRQEVLNEGTSGTPEQEELFWSWIDSIPRKISLQIMTPAVFAELSRRYGMSLPERLSRIPLSDVWYLLTAFAPFLQRRELQKIGAVEEHIHLFDICGPVSASYTRLYRCEFAKDVQFTRVAVIIFKLLFPSLVKGPMVTFIKRYPQSLRLFQLEQTPMAALHYAHRTNKIPPNLLTFSAAYYIELFGVVSVAKTSAAPLVTPNQPDASAHDDDDDDDEMDLDNLAPEQVQLSQSKVRPLPSPISTQGGELSRIRPEIYTAVSEYHEVFDLMATAVASKVAQQVSTPIVADAVAIDAVEGYQELVEQHLAAQESRQKHQQRLLHQVEALKPTARHVGLNMLRQNMEFESTRTTVETKALRDAYGKLMEHLRNPSAEYTQPRIRFCGAEHMAAMENEKWEVDTHDDSVVVDDVMEDQSMET